MTMPLPSTRDEYERRINDVLVMQMGVEPSDIKPEARIIDDLGGDNLDTLEITMELEREFGRKIGDADSERWSTVKDIYDFFCPEVNHTFITPLPSNAA